MLRSLWAEIELILGTGSVACIFCGYSLRRAGQKRKATPGRIFVNASKA